MPHCGVVAAPKTRTIGVEAVGVAMSAAAVSAVAEGGASERGGGQSAESQSDTGAPSPVMLSSSQPAVHHPERPGSWSRFDLLNAALSLALVLIILVLACVYM
jgi:hypothetical protein